MLSTVLNVLKTNFKKFLFVSMCMLPASITNLANANVLVSVKPLGFIVSAIADGVTTTEVLVPAGTSPHDYSLKPSDLLKIKKANLLVWIGDDIDVFLRKAVEKKPENQVLTLAYLTSFAIGDEEAEKQLQDTFTKPVDPTMPVEMNWHLWISPRISLVIAKAVADKLKTIYPQQSAKIDANLAQFKQSLIAKNAEIKSQLAVVKNEGFYVFHDAFQYFNHAYDLNQLGYFTINPMLATGAKSLNLIKNKIKNQQVKCIFVEPQFTPKVIRSLEKATKVKVGVLDPMGIAISLGKNSYMEFMQSLANGYTNCLAHK